MEDHTESHLNIYYDDVIVKFICTSEAYLTLKKVLLFSWLSATTNPLQALLMHSSLMVKDVHHPLFDSKNKSSISMTHQIYLPFLGFQGLLVACCWIYLLSTKCSQSFENHCT